METYVAIYIAVLFGCAVYMLQTRSILRIVIGTVFISHAANLLIISAGQLKRGGPPVLARDVASQIIVDPLPQALILTAIVIGFGVTSLLLVVAYRTVRANRSDDLKVLHGMEDDLTEVAHD